MNQLWPIRILFLGLCTAAGFAISQVRPEFVGLPYAQTSGAFIGFGFGGLMIAVDEMLKGFSLRAFSATTFGLLLATSELSWLCAAIRRIFRSSFPTCGFRRKANPTACFCWIPV